MKTALKTAKADDCLRAVTAGLNMSSLERANKGIIEQRTNSLSQTVQTGQTATQPSILDGSGRRTSAPIRTVRPKTCSQISRPSQEPLQE